jgi:hypothetical protein
MDKEDKNRNRDRSKEGRKESHKEEGSKEDKGDKPDREVREGTWDPQDTWATCSRGTKKRTSGGTNSKEGRPYSTSPMS